MCDLPGSY